MQTGGKKTYRRKNTVGHYKRGLALILILVLCSLGIMTVFAEEDDMVKEPAEVQEVLLTNSEVNIVPEHHKYIKYNGGESYTLNLDVKGIYDSSSEKRKIDVVLIIDRSGSMDKQMDNRKSRLDVVKDIVNEENGMAESILSNSNIDGKMAVVSYSGNKGYIDRAWNDAWIANNWTDSQTDISNVVERMNADGGTNCQAGLRAAKELLINARPDAEKYVVFLSDGEPTFCYNNRGITVGNGQDDRDGENAQAAYQEAETISGLTGFYSVGIISEDSGNQKNFLTTLTARTNSQKSGTYFNNSSEELIQAFQEITAEITEYTCRGVTITDTLSDYAEITSEQMEDYQVIVTDESGSQIEQLDYNGSSVTPKDLVSVVYDETLKSVTALFPSDYVLDKNYTYTIQFQVKPSQTAYDAFLSDGYLHIGSEGSDAPGNETSSGKEGFYTNEQALLSYIYGEEDAKVSSCSYVEQPVLQIQTGTIVVNKEVSGAMGDKTKLFTIEVELIKNDGTPFTGTIPVIGETKSGIEHVAAPKSEMYTFENGKSEFLLSHGQQIRINGLPVGMTYIVIEKQVEDYIVTYNGKDSEKAEGKIEDSNEVTVLNQKEYVPPTGMDDLVQQQKQAIVIMLIGFAGFAGFVAKMRGKKFKIVR